MMLLKTGFFWIILYLAFYGTVHSLLASLKAKGKSIQWFGPDAKRWYRLFFNFMAVLTFSPALILAAVLPNAAIYSIPFPWSLIFFGLQGLGIIGLIAGILQTNVFHFMGLQQISGKGLSDHPSELTVEGLYYWVRHPLYFSSLLLIWFVPNMSWNILAFNLGVTVYIIIGTIFEERKLLKAFGNQYAEYQQKTPMLIPGMKFRKISRTNR